MSLDWISLWIFQSPQPIDISPFLLNAADVWKYKNTANETKFFPHSHSISFWQMKPNNSCSGCEDFTISLVSRNTCCCRIGNVQSKSEIENKEDEFKSNGLFWALKLDERGHYWHSNREMWGTLPKYVERENVSRLSHPPPKTSISTSNRIQQWPTYIGVKILLKTINLQKSPDLIYLAPYGFPAIYKFQELIPCEWRKCLCLNFH